MDLAISQIMAGYSQGDELMADELSVGYTKVAGYKPDAGIKVMEKLYQAEKENITPIDYFRSHPYAAQRIRHIRETLHLPITVDDYMNK
jgi:predicted Zn-dependent protease